jgi:uncharacterized cupredoxin-like copper-binding protein
MMAIVAGALLLGLLGPAAATPLQNPPPPVEASIVMTEYSFKPAEIHATAGRALRVTLKNEGQKVHSLRFNLSFGELPFPSSVPPGRSVSAVFENIGDPGRFEFFCPIDDHRGHGMTGVLVVAERPPAAHGSGRR